MQYLVENPYAFSCQHVLSPESGAHDNNHLALSLLDAFGDDLQLQQHEETRNDIERLEHKINLMLLLLGSSMNTETRRPQEQILRLGTDSIGWQAEAGCQTQQVYSIILYFNRLIAIPLNCHVQIMALADGWCHGQIVDLSDEQLAIWSRWVFRQHRHFVALARHSQHKHQG